MSQMFCSHPDHCHNKLIQVGGGRPLLFRSIPSPDILNRDPRMANAKSVEWLSSPPCISRGTRQRLSRSARFGEGGRKWRGDVKCQGIRLPGLLSSPTPVLTVDEALQMVKKTMPPLPRDKFHAFFSSHYGGIITETPYMVIPIEDRLFTKGHGAFDMCLMVNGYLYNLEAHIDRFMQSLAKAGLELPYGRRDLAKTILHTAAASTKLNGFIRFWASGGRGTIGMSTKGATGPALYVLASDEDDYQKNNIMEGWSLKTTPVPVHEPYYMSTLSNSFLPYVLGTLDAEQSDVDQVAFVDLDGNVLGIGNGSICIVTQDNELIVPPAEDIIRGLTMERILELIPEFEERDLRFTNIIRRHFTVDEAQKALEVIVTGTTIPVMGIIRWDGEDIEDATVGKTALAFNMLIYNDAEYKETSTVHTEVPYGYLTGMKETNFLTI